MRQLALFTFKPKPPVLPEIVGPSYVHLESIDPNENRFRFYTITWQKTLWEEWTIRSRWGRIGGMGRSQVAYFESEGAVRETLPKIVARRMARGYRLKWADLPIIRPGFRPLAATPRTNLRHERVAGDFVAA